MPPASSHSRGGGLPWRGASVTVLETNAANGNCSSSSSPNARRAAIASKVPEALMIGCAQLDPAELDAHVCPGVRGTGSRCPRAGMGRSRQAQATGARRRPITPRPPADTRTRSERDGSHPNRRDGLRRAEPERDVGTPQSRSALTGFGAWAAGASPPQ